MEHRTVDLAPRTSVDGDRQVGDELAACLERFLTARVDEGTMERSREALTLWYRLADRHPVAAVV